MEQLLNMIVEDGLIMIPALFVIGEIVKQTETVDKRWVPVIIISVSFLLTPLVLGGYTPDNVVQAILVAGAPVLGHEVLKNGKDAQHDESID